MEFDEQKAIEYINNRLQKEYSIKYDDDEILNVIDMIFDYYEDNGMLDINCDDDDEDVDRQLIEYVAKMLKKDLYSQIKQEHIETIVGAELDYEASIQL
ncbi:MAG: hypothetical protein IJY30_04050 [Muribaculaceae bacterium]|nr:hypothetical protein [Muribaculaceae bacterium]